MDVIAPTNATAETIRAALFRESVQETNAQLDGI